VPALLVLLVLAGAPPDPKPNLKETLGDLPLSVEADRLLATAKEGVFVAEGSAVVRRGDLIVMADRIAFDQAAKSVTAEGHVTLVEPTHVLTCARVAMRFPELSGLLENAELRFKSPIPPEVRASLSAERLRHFGKDQLIVTGDEIVRESKKQLDIRGGVFTACDCGEGSTPTWEIDSTHASVDLDSGAWLTLPVFYAKGVPVFALPIFYVPLGARRSGLLAPRLNGIPDNPITGLRLSQPLYLVLGESWDATLEPGYMTRRGWSGEGELRWTPSVDAKGEAHLQLLFDHGRRTEDLANNNFSGDYHIAGHGLVATRWDLNLRHEQRFDAKAKLAADINLVGDPVFLFELVHTFLQRQAEMTSSRITLTSQSTDDSIVRAAGGLMLLQDLRQYRYHGDDPARVFDRRTVSLVSAQANGAGDVRDRFFTIRLDAAPHPLFAEDSPLLGEARLMLDAFAAPLPEMPRFARADFRPAFALPIHVFDLFVLKPEVIGRFTAWSGHADGEDAAETRFAFVAKTSLFTELGRRFGDYVHRVRPELRYLVIPVVERRGMDVFETNDEIDLLRPVSQGSARLVTDLWQANTGRRIAGFEAWIGRDFGLAAAPGANPALGTSELVLKGDFEVSPFGWPMTTRLDGRAAIDPNTRVTTELLGGLTFALSRGDSLSLLYGRFKQQVPGNSFLATEEIVPSRTFFTDRYIPGAIWSPLVYGIPGGSTPIGFADWRKMLLARQLDYALWSPYQGLAISALARPVKPLLLGFDVTIAPDRDLSPIRNTRTTIRWDSDCDCFGVGLFATTDRYQPSGLLGLPGFNVLFLISLGRLGEVRSGQ
jgi:lipopolysaccharide transport LptD-like protein